MSVDPAHGKLSCRWFLYIYACPNLEILGVLFDSKLTFEFRELSVVSRVS